MGRRLRILFVEDSESDVLLIARELRRGGLAHEFTRVESAGAMESAAGKASPLPAP